MSAFAQESAKERAVFINQYASSSNIPSYIVEKDFWVCWLLGRIFATPGVGDECVFKGGTSLSKVFSAIMRFSEDIDLAVLPSSLGWNEEDLDDAPSVSQRRKRVEKISEACAEAVETRFREKLEIAVSEILGKKPGDGEWLTYELEASTQSPVLYFSYPQAVDPGRGLHSHPLWSLGVNLITELRM